MNIKGSDAGIILPNSLIPTWNDEPQYKCTCGFSAVVHRHRSYNSGLFYEDELEVTGSVCDNMNNSVYSSVNIKTEAEQSESRKLSLHLENIPGFVLDLLKIQLAARGADDQCEPQPIPSLLLGHEKDSIALSPFSLKYWDKLHLEPSSLRRDIAYIVVAPENDVVLSTVKFFFRELSCIYEALHLGKHRPITKVLRDGIMRVGKTAASKVAEEPVSEWFNTIGDGPISNKLKLYARVCKHRLESSDKSSLPKQAETEYSTESHSSTTHESSEDHDQNIPSLVIYIVEPFTYGQSDPDVYRLVSLGIMHAYVDMMSNLPDALKNAIHLQVLSLDSIMCYGGNKIKTRRNKSMRHHKDKLKTLALSVYSQTYVYSAHQHTVKSLTGFGPAAAQDKFINNRNSKVYPTYIYNQPYVIASVKDKQTELNEMFGDRREKKCGILYCSYCLTKDRKYILACCTNDKGEFTDTTIINIEIPNRQRRKQCSVRKYGLRKLLEFILEVISLSVHPWRIIIDRFGRLGHGELKAWASLLNRKSLQSYSKHLKDTCNQCNISNLGDGPSILSACLVSLGPDSALRIVHDQFTPDDRFSTGRYRTCSLNTPEDATCTHILVFPYICYYSIISSNISSRADRSFARRSFETLDDDMNDIFHWTESPTHSAGNSPSRDGCSQPSSPSSSFRLSSSNHGEQNKCETILTENYDEALQLLQQPLALGYYVSTAKVGPVPKWFWASCPQLENKLPVFLKSALLIHLPFIQQNSDEWLPNNNQQQLLCHPLDSNFTTDVLRYVLEGYNALSWLQLDSKYGDRRSCLPIHMQLLMQLYGIVETIL
ncbi:mediator of RNA polymerase II transcription subunit 13 [Caerostris extrusa]|uniref:Mediator of RNA polymerase II transcription subunit 13 n=1 Tax=Caerostris extrusa TaxID=172846 RepID=A0AAV4MD92_CAEEX|nr:mediator of RNA polymerase II transcription subunit 13 [Caerostris extrusa]